ncbi:MAG: MiaB/RimO family radical SAM methylthiotransferase [Clostridia bacterium]|nr:MiaB/RimO family radical SAM methylthiotransferase [Clostridia bacterium]
MKVAVFTLGCKVNEVESASMMSSLEDMGLEVTDKLRFADIYILNTCAVTKEAEKKSRQLIARARKWNPDAKIYVCGCATEKDGTAFTEKGCTVFGAKDKERVVEYIASEYGLPYCGGLLYPKQVKTRAFVKISDGCNRFCSYCVIPYLRGRVVNRPIEDIVEEIRHIDSLEIVLTGIDISAYDEGGGLYALIDALKDVKSRIRLGSLECNVIDERLLESLSGLRDFAPQFHLSLQSGSDRVLKAMNRHYTREEYLEKCRLIYKYFPLASITTDIIVGFPTETYEDFQETLSIIEEAGFARIHAFPYSPREGTVAYGMKQISGLDKSDRMYTLLKAADKAEARYVASFYGKEEKVLWEKKIGDYMMGYTGNYIKVFGLGFRKGMEKVHIGSYWADFHAALNIDDWIY